MTTDLTYAALAEWLRAERDVNVTTPALVVSLTSNEFVCETPEGFTVDETAALAVWVRAATKVAMRDRAV
jgi:hypothetical protein